MKRLTLIMVVVGLLLIGGTGFFAYTRGVEAGYAKANDIRNDFFRSRGIAGGFGGAGGGAAAAGEPGAAGAAAGAGGGRSGNGGGATAAASPAAARGGAAAAGGAAGAFGGTPAAFGRIQQINDDSIVLTSRDGSSITVKLADATTIMRQARAERSALKDGMNVTVIGDTGSDGTIAARSVTILGAPGAETSQASTEPEQVASAGSGR